jgi:HSP20 family protein
LSRPGRRYTGVETAPQLRAELDKLFQDLLAASETTQRSGWTPALDVIDAGRSLLILVEVAGLQPADLRIEVEGATVRIKGRRKLDFTGAGAMRFHCLERPEGKFVRQVEIREPVDFRHATASLRDGVLRLELPKVEERRKRLQVIDVVELAEDAPASAADGAGEPQAAGSETPASIPVTNAGDEPS